MRVLSLSTHLSPLGQAPVLLCGTISKPGSAWSVGRMTRPAAAVLGFLAVLLIAADCGSDVEESGGNPTLEVRGIVTDVEAMSLLELELLRVTDEQNTEWEFRPGRDGVAGVGHVYTPSHLRQHMVQGVPIIVTYRENDGVLTIVSISE